MRCPVKLEDYSIDDLHQMATAEFDAFPELVATMNEAYVVLRMMYIAEYRHNAEKVGPCTD